MKAYIVYSINEDWGELAYAANARRARWLVADHYLPYQADRWDHYTAFKSRRWPSMDKYAVAEGIEENDSRKVESGWFWTCRECHAVIVDCEDGLCGGCRND